MFFSKVSNEAPKLFFRRLRVTGMKLKHLLLAVLLVLPLSVQSEESVQLTEEQRAALLETLEKYPRLEGRKFEQHRHYEIIRPYNRDFMSGATSTIQQLIRDIQLERDVPFDRECFHDLRHAKRFLEGEKATTCRGQRQVIRRHATKEDIPQSGLIFPRK